MGRRAGEISITEAAQILQKHPDTVRRWILFEKLHSRRDVTGHHWIKKNDIIKKEEPAECQKNPENSQSNKPPPC